MTAINKQYIEKVADKIGREYITTIIESGLINMPKYRPIVEEAFGPDVDIEHESYARIERAPGDSIYIACLTFNAGPLPRFTIMNGANSDHLEVYKLKEIDDLVERVHELRAQ